MTTLGFTGRGSEYFRIWIVNILLTIVTLTLYYPWAKVRTRRYFLGNTTLQGRGLDYHATGKQLLPGYLIVVVIVLLYVVVQSVAPMAGLVLIPVAMLALPWIVWRSLSFNARMTSFSTVRFGFEGTAGGAYVNYLVWPVLVIAVLAVGPLIAAVLAQSDTNERSVGALVAALASLVCYPLAFVVYVILKRRQTRYVIDGHRYGQGRFATTVRASGFAMIIFKTIMLSLLMVLAIVALLALLALATGAADQLVSMIDELEDADAVQSLFGERNVLILVAALYLAFLLAAMFVAAYAHTRKRSYVFGHTRLDDTISFASTLSATRLAWVWLTNLLLVAVTLGLAVPWAATRLARVRAENTEVETSGGLDRYVDRQRADQSSLGEQIGDAFDVDVGIGF